MRGIYIFLMANTHLQCVGWDLDRLETPESKRQLMEWRESSSPVATKTKQILTPKEIMCTVSWYSHGILLADFLLRRETISANGYCETLRKPCCSIQNKRRRMLTNGIILIYDNGRPHTENKARQLLQALSWSQFDFHLFLQLKTFLGGQHFNTGDELKEQLPHV